MTLKKLAFSTTSLSLIAGAGVANADVWQLLGEIGIEEIVTETTYEVRKSYPPALANGAEVDVEITGYATPAMPGEMVRDLLLVSDMGLCPFCGSLEHGASLSVQLSDDIPVIDDGTRLTLRGTLQPNTDPETWQSVVLKDAVIISQ